MLIDKQLEDMPLELEIENIINFIKTYKKKWGKNNLAFLNKNTIEDKLFIAIHKKFKKELGNLTYLENLNELKDNEIFINTNNLLDEEIQNNRVKVEVDYSLKIFADYIPDYINELAKYFGIEKNNKTKSYKISKNTLDVYQKYSYNNILNLLDLDKEVREELVNLIADKRKNKIKKIINTYHIKNI